MLPSVSGRLCPTPAYLPPWWFTMAAPSPRPQAPVADHGSGGTLCLSCGLCCQGVLHSHAGLEPHEETSGIRQRLRLPLFNEGQDYPAFALPCPQHREGRCAAYPDRPAVCERYQCNLLIRHRAGEIPLDEALTIVQRTKAVVERVRTRLGPESAGRWLWGAIWSYSRKQEEAVGAEEFRRGHRDFLLDLGELQVLCHRRFEARKPIALE